jgi:catalase (peroxidase I)
MSKGKKFKEYTAKAQIKLSLPMVLAIARKVPKEDFLSQLKPQWIPYIKENSTISDDITMVQKRIKLSGLSKAFEVAGITNTDIRKVLEEIRVEKYGVELKSE